MSWTELFMMVAIVDSIVIWFALAGSKRWGDPIDFDVDKLPPGCAFKGY